MSTLTRTRAAGRLHPLVRLLWFGPLVALILIWPEPARGLAAWEWGLFLSAGLLLWTLIEYLLHRFAFHWVPRSKRLRELQSHLDHHAHPEDPRNSVARLTLSVPVALAVWILLVLATGSWQLGAVFTAGAILGYLFYELVHFSTHFSRLERGPFRFWREHHFEHHRNAGRCFGFTTPLWDLVFGTGPKRSARSSASEHV